MPQVSYPEHEAKAAVKRRYDYAVAKDDARGRASKPDKDETGNDRDPDHAEEDLDRNHNVPINRRRIVVTITNGSKRLDAEEEGLGERARRQVGDAVP